MNENKKKRYEELKRINKEKAIKLEWKKNLLLQECLETLGENGDILGMKEKDKILEMFYKRIPMSKHSRVDWRKIHSIKNINNPLELLSETKNKDFYIIWDEFNLPVIKSRLYDIVKSINDITAVSFDTWLLGVNMNEIIEFYNENITYGNV